MSHRTGVRLAEVGYLLYVIGGIWLAAGQVPRLRFTAGRTIVAGLAFAAGGILLIIATHSGGYGR